jgi:hypothetical protein
LAGVAASTSATISANNYQAQVAQRNADLMNENARRAIDVAQQEQIQQDQKTRGLLGEQVAAQSASGLKLGGRSYMLTRKSARQLGRLDALNIRQDGDITAFNYRMAAQDNLDQITQLKSANKTALLSGFLDAASVGLTGLKSSNFLQTKEPTTASWIAENQPSWA